MKINFMFKLTKIMDKKNDTKGFFNYSFSINIGTGYVVLKISKNKKQHTKIKTFCKLGNMKVKEKTK